MKVECQKRCFSTLNHNLAYCYNASPRFGGRSNKLSTDLKGPLATLIASLPRCRVWFGCQTRPEIAAGQEN